MTFLKEYSDYLKDNPEGYWFKRKLYGWGWAPARWQGWAITGVYLALVFVAAFSSSLSVLNLTEEQLLLSLIVLTIIFLIIAWRTGEPPKWQWGNKNPKV